MLETLHIENYALIRHTDVAFDKGFTVITGETGAGKSILLGALGLLLGQRADTQVLADKERKCVVEASFDIAGLGLEPLFAQYEADYDDHLILRREILPSAKSRAFVNDSPASVQMLKELAPHILDIHSQYQTLTLTDSTFQTQLLDTFAGDSPLPQYHERYDEYVTLKRHLEQLTARDAQLRREEDYDRFLYDELCAARLQPGEQQELEEESRLMEHTGTIKEALSALEACCEGNGDEGALSLLSMARSRLSQAASCHPDIEKLYSRLDSCMIELQDLLSDASSLDERLQYSPERQAAVTERLDLVYRLEKKHGVEDIDALCALQRQLEEKLEAAGNLDEEIRATMEQVDRAFAALQQEADRLTASRRRAAEAVGKSLLPVLGQLGMASARIEAEVAPAADYGPLGHDNVRLLFNANKGGGMRPLAEVASGGELSRLMLSVKSVVTERSLLPTIIFDEIDSGVSGDISVAVGNIMRSMAQHMQVIAISHLPQIAAKAHRHFKVAKGSETAGTGAEERTVSHIAELDESQRVTEIAVMLSSNPPTAAALQTARELMALPSGQ